MLLRLGRYSFGFTHDLIATDGEPYLERWILWLGGSLRMHRFLASDEDRAVHDHPWWFVTVPFSAYAEFVQSGEGELRRLVRPFRPHFRGARFRHRVELQRYPTWTLVLTGAKSRDWGFWNKETFVHSDDWQPAKAQETRAQETRVQETLGSTNS